MSAIIIIPARLHSTRLPAKVLELINGQPMLFHVAERAIAADVGPVVIAVDHQLTMQTAQALGLHCVMTSPGHDSGTDRVGEAIDLVDGRGHFQNIINVQADVPMINPAHIRAAVALLEPHPHIQGGDCDIATLCAVDDDPANATNPHVVKVIGTPIPTRANDLRALYFTRSTPFGRGPLYHHIGLYAYRRQALNRLRRLPMGTLERREGLEQLRALECGLRIDATIVDELPISVDTPADLDRVRESLDGAR